MNADIKRRDFMKKAAMAGLAAVAMGSVEAAGGSVTARADDAPGSRSPDAKAQSKNEQIGFCGYDCSSCGARSEDPEVRQKLVDGWRKYLGHQMYTVENVKCCGCRGDGEVADKGCKVRPCAKAKGIDSCVDCGQFPCGKVKNLVCCREDLIFQSYPASSALTKEEYNLCMKQFDSLPNLIKKMIDKKMLPDWLKNG